MKMFITGSKSLQDVTEIRKYLKRNKYNPSVVYTYDRKGVDDSIRKIKKIFKYDHIERDYNISDKKTFRNNLKDLLNRVEVVLLFWDGYSKDVLYISKWCELLNKNYIIIKMRK
jgi:hypothetical protein